MRCHGTMCPLLTALFLFLSVAVTFLPEGVIVGFQSFAWGLSHKINKIWGKTKFGGPPPAPKGVNFLGFVLEKKIKVLRIA